MQCRLRAQRPRASNNGLRTCPLRTEISPVSLKRLIILCTVDRADPPYTQNTQAA